MLPTYTTHIVRTKSTQCLGGGDAPGFCTGILFRGAARRGINSQRGFSLTKDPWTSPPPKDSCDLAAKRDLRTFSVF